MTSNWSPPAVGVSVTVHPPSSDGRAESRIRKGTGFVLFRGLLPLLIAALLVVLVLGGAGGILVLVAVAVIAALLAVMVRYRRNKSFQLYSSSPRDFMSRACFYDGPFDTSGIPEAASFERKHSTSYRVPPQVRLLVTNYALVFGPAGHSGSPLMVPFKELRSVDLVKGTRPRMLVVTPPIAERVGRVELRTTQGHRVRFSGLPIKGVLGALRERGATIEDED